MMRSRLISRGIQIGQSPMNCLAWPWGFAVYPDDRRLEELLRLLGSGGESRTGSASLRTGPSLFFAPILDSKRLPRLCYRETNGVYEELCRCRHRRSAQWDYSIRLFSMRRGFAAPAG